MSAFVIGTSTSAAADATEIGLVVDFNGSKMVVNGTSQASETPMSPEVTRDARLRICNETPLFYWTAGTGTPSFQTPSQVFYRASASTMDTSLNVRGCWLVNNASTTAANTNVGLTTYPVFTVPQVGALCMTVKLAAKNATYQHGLMQAGLGISGSNIGAWFEWTTTGTLVAAMIGSNGSTIFSDAIPLPDTTGIPGDVPFHNYVIQMSRSAVDYFIDGELVATLLPLPHSPNALVNTTVRPFFNSQVLTTAATAAKTLEIAGISITSKTSISQSLGQSTGRQSYGNYNAPIYETSGQTANYTNSVAPATSTNWPLSYASFGGQWRSATNWPASADTDQIVFTFAKTNGISGESSHNFITGVRIGETVVTTALSNAGLILEWTLSVSTQTGNPGVQIIYYLPLGFQSFTSAAVGTVAPGFDMPLNIAPIAHTFGGAQTVAINARVIGTAVTSGVIRGTVSLMGYLE